jgi:hypothetical protein
MNPASFLCFTTYPRPLVLCLFAVAVAYIAAVVELSLACLCFKRRFVVEIQCLDVNTINKKTSLCPGCFQSAIDLEFKHPLCMVRSDAVAAAVLICEGFSDEVANAKECRRKIPVLADD